MSDCVNFPEINWESGNSFNEDWSPHKKVEYSEEDIIQKLTQCIEEKIEIEKNEEQEWINIARDKSSLEIVKLFVLCNGTDFINKKSVFFFLQNTTLEFINYILQLVDVTYPDSLLISLLENPNCTVEFIKEIIRRYSITIDNTKTKDRNPVEVAVKSNQSVEIIQYLHSLGANVFQKDSEDETLFHIAAKFSTSVEVLRYLVDAGVEYLGSNTDYGNAFYYLMENQNASVELLDYLVELGIDIHMLKYPHSFYRTDVLNEAIYHHSSNLKFIQRVVDHYFNISKPFRISYNRNRYPFRKKGRRINVYCYDYENDIEPDYDEIYDRYLFDHPEMNCNNSRYLYRHNDDENLVSYDVEEVITGKENCTKQFLIANYGKEITENYKSKSFYRRPIRVSFLKFDYSLCKYLLDEIRVDVIDQSLFHSLISSIRHIKLELIVQKFNELIKILELFASKGIDMEAMETYEVFWNISDLRQRMKLYSLLFSHSKHLYTQTNNQKQSILDLCFRTPHCHFSNELIGTVLICSREHLPPTSQDEDDQKSTTPVQTWKNLFFDHVVDSTPYLVKITNNCKYTEYEGGIELWISDS